MKKKVDKKSASKKVASKKKVAPTQETKQENYVILRLDYEIGVQDFWRQIVVPKTLSLRNLHMVIQAAFNWCAYHAYAYEQDGQEYGSDEFVDEFPEFGYRKTSDTNVCDLFKKAGDTAEYTYDFGDNNVVKITCKGYSKEFRKADFATAGQDAVEDSSGVGFIPGIVKLLTKGAKTEKGCFCRDWLHWAFELTPEEVMHIPTTHEIFTRVLIALRGTWKDKPC